MTELSTQSITMDNLPASQLEYHIKNYDGDIEELGIELFKAGNKTKHGFVVVVKRIEEEALARGEKPTEVRERYLQRVFGKDQSTGRYYVWENAYKVLEGLSDDVKDKAFRYGEAFGVTNLKTINSINNARVKHGDPELTSDEIENVMQKVVDKGLNVKDATAFMKDTCLPKQDDDNVPNFDNEIKFDDGKPKLITFKIREDDVEYLQGEFDIDVFTDDPVERGNTLVRNIQTQQLLSQAAESNER